MSCKHASCSHASCSHESCSHASRSLASHGHTLCRHTLCNHAGRRHADRSAHVLVPVRRARVGSNLIEACPTPDHRATTDLPPREQFRPLRRQCCDQDQTGFGIGQHQFVRIRTERNVDDRLELRGCGHLRDRAVRIENKGTAEARVDDESRCSASTASPSGDEAIAVGINVRSFRPLKLSEVLWPSFSVTACWSASAAVAGSTGSSPGSPRPTGYRRD